MGMSQYDKFKSWGSSNSKNRLLLSDKAKIKYKTYMLMNERITSVMGECVIPVRRTSHGGSHSGTGHGHVVEGELLYL
jgi:hypothetical protein